MGGGCSKDGGSDGASEPSAAARPRALPIRPPDAARCRAGRPGDAPSEPTVDRKHTEPEPATLDGDAAPLMGEPWAQVADEVVDVVADHVDGAGLAEQPCGVGVVGGNAVASLEALAHELADELGGEETRDEPCAIARRPHDSVSGASREVARGL